MNGGAKFGPHLVWRYVQKSTSQPERISGDVGAVVVVQKSFPAGGSVHIVGEVDMSDAFGGLEKGLYRQDDIPGQGGGKTLGVAHIRDGAAGQNLGQTLVW